MEEAEGKLCTNGNDQTRVLALLLCGKSFGMMIHLGGDKYPSYSGSSKAMSSSKAPHPESSFVNVASDDGSNTSRQNPFCDNRPPTTELPYSTLEMTLDPSPEDIICGRGKMTISHPGNLKFRDLIMERKEEYQLARRREDKTQITIQLVQTLREEGRKFLLFDSKSQRWYDVGDEYAREKVSHSLRSRPRDQGREKSKPRKKSTMKQDTQSSALDDIVSQLISDQQLLLQNMIANDSKHDETPQNVEAV